MSSKILLQRSPAKTRMVWAITGCLGALIAFGVIRFTQPQPDPAVQASGSAPSSQGHDFVRSFMGTTPDGQLADQGQDLVLSPALIRRFEYHLTAVGERTQEQIRAAILKDISTELNARGQKEAQRILDAYLKFKTALGSVSQPKMGEVSAVSLALHFKAIRDLRAQYFSPDEVKALFGSGDEYEDYTVRKVAITQNPSLTAAEREAQLEQLKSTLSPEGRANIEQPVIHLTLAAKEQAAREHGATAAEIQQIRTDLVGADAAKRLAALDKEEAAWQERIRQYKEARAKDPAQAEQLKNTLFTPREQLRLAAYE
ncbi:MAG TPA: lipase secretion chaperone [Aquabacterium sp.]|nr:lipase secretion chaperone [Aquabacterium sp.]